MNIFSISDLHLSISTDKPMDIFGDGWKDHFGIITEDWQNRVTNDDIVLIGGDISWAMTLDQAVIDFAEIRKLNGTKIIIKGNHDFWWSSYSKVKSAINDDKIIAIQNNAVAINGFIFCGSRGWNVPNEESSDEDKKIYERELCRLKLSLDYAKLKQKNGEILVGLMHFPPFNVRFDDSGFTDLFAKYGVQKVIYGHLHGKNCRNKSVVEKRGVQYILTSCDQVDNKLVQIY